MMSVELFGNHLFAGLINDLDEGDEFNLEIAPRSMSGSRTPDYPGLVRGNRDVKGKATLYPEADDQIAGALTPRQLETCLVAQVPPKLNSLCFLNRLEEVKVLRDHQVGNSVPEVPKPQPLTPGPVRHKAPTFSDVPLTPGLVHRQTPMILATDPSQPAVPPPPVPLESWAPPGLERANRRQEAGARKSATVGRSALSNANAMPVVSVGTVGHPNACNGPCTEEPVMPECASVGSIGHPVSCALACKYHFKRQNCKDGKLCVRCHLCRWSRFGEKCNRRGGKD